ncbi:MAG TPA: undecaprenyl-diphosphate phosphatase [Solirubrobacteraceae bacterium]|nr:undecaprenyl-diphosphate phosphatase [Solirubrobacteraceae bacterium]
MPRRAEPGPRAADTVALGLLQGPAELLPISSSAHVELLGSRLAGYARLSAAERKELAVALHAGSGVALAARGLPRRERLGLLAVATAPAALAGFLLEGPIERRLSAPGAMAAGLVAGSILMVAADRRPQRRGADEAGLGDALWLGLAQATALAPGVSRSGAVRSAARARGFTRAAAAELAAETALPIMAGATLLKGARVAARRPAAGELAALGAGALAAAASTALARAVTRRFEPPAAVWAAYRIALAVAVSSDRRVRHNGRR